MQKRDLLKQKKGREKIKYMPSSASDTQRSPFLIETAIYQRKYNFLKSVHISSSIYFEFKVIQHSISISLCCAIVPLHLNGFLTSQRG